jgi:hypothetical protein
MSCRLRRSASGIPEERCRETVAAAEAELMNMIRAERECMMTGLDRIAEPATTGGGRL